MTEIAKPKRIQRRRLRGWTMPPDAIYVGRPTKWGNPFKIRPAEQTQGWQIPAITPELAVKLYRDQWELRLYGSGEAGYVATRKLLDELRGKDLVCWCPPDSPCHADVLLDLANK